MPKALIPDNKACDLCKLPLKRGERFYDARTSTGQWAWMCIVCFVLEGARLGLGMGQAYDSQSNDKVGG